MPDSCIDSTPTAPCSNTACRRCTSRKRRRICASALRERVGGGADRFKVQLTANKQLHDKIRQAQDLMRHELPNGDIAGVLERALDLLIADRMKRRFAQTTKPRRTRASAAAKPGSRHVPNEVRRQVLERDGARCTFVSVEGKRCDERGWLQLHHEEPFARGGSATLENIRMLCGPHNRLLAERDYGRAFVHQRIESARSHERR